MHSAAVVARALAVVFATIAALHAYWAVAGVSNGSAAIPTRADGQPLFRPGRAATLAVAVALLAAAFIVLVRVGLIASAGPFVLYQVGAFAIGAVLLLRTIGDFRYVGLFKRERASRFAQLDTMFYTPLCAVLAAASFYVAAS